MLGIFGNDGACADGTAGEGIFGSEGTCGFEGMLGILGTLGIFGTFSNEGIAGFGGVTPVCGSDGICGIDETGVVSVGSFGGSAPLGVGGSVGNDGILIVG